MELLKRAQLRFVTEILPGRKTRGLIEAGDLNPQI
ncbi:hypothetical protein NIES2100_12850 [Calothrix sp. NIES-2100]|nr:hypothetical protein NIES2100_12850 [Calothrix sp. NIES-2100]